MRYESAITSVSWIPSEAIPGMMRLPFDLGPVHYDDPPGDSIGDIPNLASSGAVRFVNELRAWVEVEDGWIVRHGHLGRGWIGKTKVGFGSRLLLFRAIGMRDIRPEPEASKLSVRFVQTAGGRPPLPLPRKLNRPPFVQIMPPVVWTTLALTMKADGSGKKQLTKKPGYDGGAVFSRDGKKLVWRANYPKNPEDMARYQSLLKDNLTTPMKMEIVVADADGGNAKTVTDFGCASFAPTFTPDGKKILFASNKNECDSRRFELFLINVDGTGLEQVTSFGGFTSFPEFSPDGNKLVFCSDRGAKERYEFNIFTADWDAR